MRSPKAAGSGSRKKTASASLSVSSPKAALSPSVDHIASVLEERVRSGAYPRGRWLPSERELAGEFGVSRVTIRQVIDEMERRELISRSARCRPLVRPLTNGQEAGVERVQGGLSGKRRSVALWLWPDNNDPGSARILRGIRRVLNPDDYRLMLEFPHGGEQEHPEKPEAAFLRRILADSDIEGLILWYLGGEQNLPVLNEVRAAGIPIVFLDRQPPEGFDADYVGVDNAESAAAATRHLLSRGHRNIIHVTNSERVSTVAERLDGYRRALSLAGIPFRPDFVLRDTGPSLSDPYHGCRRAAEEIVRLRAGSHPPTGIFAVNDHTALILIETLRECGLRVPEDIALVGFDGVERDRPGLSFLTTVQQPFERMGSRAVELLLDRRRLGPAAPIKHIVLEAGLYIGGSTVAFTPAEKAAASV
jgi:DNA-binding LacI/PurR family transcriptional regulator